MSRFTTQAPFTPNAAFVALRRITLASRNYVPGDKIERTKISDRVLRTLYEQRKIGYDEAVIAAIEATAGQAPEGNDAPAGGADTQPGAGADTQPGGDTPAGGEGNDTIADGQDTTAGAEGGDTVAAAQGEDTIAPAEGGDTVAGGTDEPKADAAPAQPRFKTKNAGFGGFKVVDTVTTETVASWPTKEEADADVAQRNAGAAPVAAQE